MTTQEKQMAEGFRKAAGGPLTAQELKYLQDLRGLADFVIRNGLGFKMVLGILSHDLSEIRVNEWDLEKALKTGFLPKVNNYARYSEDSAGQTETDDED